MSGAREIQVTVNGRNYRRTVEPRRLLADFLREDIGLTGTHVGCEQGVCGACTVLIEGASARSCLTLAIQVDGLAVATVEGLGEVDTLSPLQQKFREHHALQCGFCTPGMLMTATDILARGEPLTDTEIRNALSGNLCRCADYDKILNCAMRAAELARSV